MSLRKHGTDDHALSPVLSELQRVPQPAGIFSVFPQYLDLIAAPIIGFMDAPLFGGAK
jgi:hypothetical protein